jgi:hypothetical protein
MIAASSSRKIRLQWYWFLIVFLAVPATPVHANPSITVAQSGQGGAVVVLDGAKCEELPAYMAESELRKLADQLQQLLGCDIGQSINKWKAAQPSQPSNGEINAGQIPGGGTTGPPPNRDCVPVSPHSKEIIDPSRGSPAIDRHSPSP